MIKISKKQLRIWEKSANEFIKEKWENKKESLKILFDKDTDVRKSQNKK